MLTSSSGVSDTVDCAAGEVASARERPSRPIGAASRTAGGRKRKSSLRGPSSATVGGSTTICVSAKANSEPRKAEIVQMIKYLRISRLLHARLDGELQTVVRPHYTWTRPVRGTTHFAPSPRARARHSRSKCHG